ncbi:MAG: S1 family peptidase [Chloroflexota bacterium]
MHAEEAGAIDDGSAEAMVGAYAELFGVSRATAASELDEMSAIAELEARLRDAMPDTFAGLWISHEPYGVHVAALSAADHGLISKLAADSGVLVAPVVESAGSSLAQLEAAASLVSQLVPGDLDINVIENRIDVSVADKSSAMSAVAAIAAETKVRIDLRQVATLAEPATNVTGGLGGSSIGWSGCPSGFTVKQQISLPVYGFITAGHCGNTSSYQGITFGFAGECLIHSCDSQWFVTAPATVTAQFVWNAGQLFWVTGTKTLSNITIGSLVCKYGPVTGYTCGTVQSKSFKPSWVPQAYPTFVKVGNCNANLVSPGDSGGPVFNGGTAYGIVSGYEIDIFCNSVNKLIFTALDQATVPLNVAVLVH